MVNHGDVSVACPGSEADGGTLILDIHEGLPPGVGDPTPRPDLDRLDEIRHGGVLELSTRHGTWQLEAQVADGDGEFELSAYQQVSPDYEDAWPEKDGRAWAVFGRSSVWGWHDARSWFVLALASMMLASATIIRRKGCCLTEDEP